MSTYQPRLDAHDLPRALPVIEARQRWQAIKPGPMKRLAFHSYYDAQYAALAAGLDSETLTRLVYSMQQHDHGPAWCSCLACKTEVAR